MLCIKNSEKIDLDELLLWNPYKNIISNFVKLCTEKNAAVFDSIARVYDGLESITPELENYYESLLGVTSYFQASKGGRGKYIEKKLATINTHSSLNVELSELPFYFENTELHKKKGIFTLKGLNSRERQLIRNSGWIWRGENDISFDLINVIKDENVLILMEHKNRVDSGGTSARREMWISKFRNLLETFTRNESIFVRVGDLTNEEEDFTLLELLTYFNISRLELYCAILFNLDGTPATKNGDKSEGFYTTSKEGYLNNINYLNLQDSIYDIVERDDDNLRLEVEFIDENFKIGIEAVYGNQIPQKLFRKDYPISELLLLKYDDIWLSQLLSIDERTFLLKYDTNFMAIFKKLIKRDFKLKQSYNKFINNEGDLEDLEEIVTYLLEEYSEELEDKLVPKDVTKEQYLADVIQVLASAEA